MSSSQLNNNNEEQEENKDLEYEESKEDEYNSNNNNNNNNNIDNNNNDNTSANNWISTINDLHLQSQSRQSLIFIRLFADIFSAVSKQTQISLTFLFSGGLLIFISLPHKIIGGVICLLIGTLGIISIITHKYIKFAQQRGLISFMKPGIIKHFILHGSITDIFYEIRNSKLGIPDFLLSQILPLDDAEREMIFERLPEMTRDVVSTEGLIYLTPQAIQNIVLPLHLKLNNNNNNNNANDNNELNDLSSLGRLSPVTGSPHSSQQNTNDNNERSLRDGIIKNNTVHIDNHGHSNNDNEHVNENDNDPISSNIVYDTKNEMQSMGKQWLWKNQEIINGNNMNANGNANENGNTALSVIESTSNDSSSNNDNNNIYEEKKVIDDEYLLNTPNKNSNSNMNHVPAEQNNNVNNNKNISWIGHVTKLFGGNDSLATKPIIKAVIDTRMKELALYIISYVWKSPFAQISDSQLVVIFICCVSIIAFYLTKNKEIRNKFIKSMKYMGIMALFWIGILCFIELNIRRKSKLSNKIFDYINKQLFHSEHHKEVRERKKSLSELRKTKSMRMYSESSMSRANLLDQLKTRKIAYKDKKSKFSRTMPFMQSKHNMRNMNNIMDQSAPSESDSLSISLSESESQSQSPYTQHLINKKQKNNINTNTLYLRRRNSDT